MTRDELKKRLTDTIGLISVPGVGRGRFNRLVRQFGSPAKALKAPVNRLEAVTGISHSIAADIKTKYDAEAARQTAARIIQLGWTVLFPDQPDFPPSLMNIPAGDIPPVLFCTGENVTPDEKMIAIVGTRHPTERGRMFAYNLAASLASAGITVVSGMAEGIDSAAHKGALEAGGRTVAIWGNSLDLVYPPSNKGLAQRIKESGAVFSEYLPQTSPSRANFPERNRIISGLSDGVVVIQAGLKSGALITASYAIEQGRELFAVPEAPGLKSSEGANELIKKGARLLTSIDDIFDELPRLKGEVLTRKFCRLPDMTDTEKQIVSLFSAGPRQVDQISREVDLPVPEIMEFLLALKLKGVVRELSGKRFVLSEEYA
ncbi:MAG: DNA-processing protein DprA [candidate division Zixibacteria bacterium]|nr:DNA-processing protein DprA [candidate division Zixibacteria bacterium]